MTKRDYLTAGGLAVFTFLFYSLFTWHMPVTDPVESNYVLTATEMMQAHDYLTPRIYGAPWFDKPILVYWGLLASMSLFGNSDFALRLPSLCTAALTIGTTFLVWRKLTHRYLPGLIAAAVLGTSLQFWYISHAIVTDGYLYLFTLGIFYHAYQGLNTYTTHANLTTDTAKATSPLATKHIIIAYACAGLSILTKGPVGLVLPGLILLIYCLFTRRYKDCLRLFSPWGLFICALIAVPWYGYMYYLHGADYIMEFLGLHNVVRATVSEHPEMDVWYYYLLLLVVQILPWTGLIIYEMRQLLRLRRHLSPLIIYTLVWLMGTLLFYSLMSTKYITYTFIALIPLTYLIADGALRLSASLSSKRLTLPVMVLPFFLLLLGLSIAAPLFFPEARLAIWSMAIVDALLILQHYRHRLRLLGSVIIAMIVFYGTLSYALLPVIEDASAREASTAIPKDYTGDIYIYYTFATSFNFYSGREAYLLLPDDIPNTSRWQSFREGMPKKFPNDVAQEMRIKPSTPVIVLVPTSKEKYFTALPISQYVTPQRVVGKYLLYSNNSL